MIQAVYVPKARAIYAKAHIKMTNELKPSTIKVYEADPVKHPNTGEDYFRFAVAGPKADMQEIMNMTGDYYQPSKKLKAFAARMS